jgi:hypothetical protein
MRFVGAVLLVWTTTSNNCIFHGSAWSPSLRQSASLSSTKSRSVRRTAVPGADIEHPPLAVEQETPVADVLVPSKSDIPTAPGPTSLRGKVNEIDFCIAPADVSLSRAYGTTTTSFSGSSSTITANTDSTTVVGLSLTRALNNASNRAVRRILLSRSWPSAEALNRSLRQVAAMEAAARELEKAGASSSSNSSTGAKCPVPRPILNVLTRNQSQQSSSSSSDDAPTDSSKSRKKVQPSPCSRTDEQYVADQLQSFQDTYGTLTGYSYAQDYLECVLSLATTGVESEKVRAVLSSGIYDEAYKRILSVLRTVGVEFVTDPATKSRRIAPKLKDQDICLSIIDKIQMRQEKEGATMADIPSKAKAEDVKTAVESSDEPATAGNKKTTGFKFWQKNEIATELTGDDLGGVLLSANEPTMTRQLNILSNIIQRALLFGGDQELLVLAETLDADMPAFIEHWYPGTQSTPFSTSLVDSEEAETRPGVNYLSCLIKLLRKCYASGVVTDLNPPVKLLASYANAYERLVASAVELGSGYLKPAFGAGIDSNVPKPRTAQEELGRFAVWESNFRQSAASLSPPASATATYSPYPVDLVGSWEVRDEIGGETIGSSTVTFNENGNVQVAPPLEGLRWRLDPGPTHLDTCTFQVLSTLDGTILQYRGFIDRGARLEARFSKRLIKIRGSVMFQMRDGASVDYYKDMLPINYRTGTTKFVMTKMMQ